jgi:hypothetical protein
MAQQENRSALAIELRGQVNRYLSGQLSFTELQAWLAPRSWLRHAPFDREGAHLFAAVQTRLDEYAAGYWSESLLHDSLKAVLEAH